MNAPTPALVAPRPERLRLVGQRRQILTMMHQRLMFGLLVYAGVVALIVLRILYLAAFGDHAGAKRGLTVLVPERGDIVDRDGQPLARTIDAWTVGLWPGKVIGNKLDLARKLARLMPEKDEATYERIFRRYDIDPSSFVMVGNSLRSDILPVVEAGGWAVHIPAAVSWSHEDADAPAHLHGRFVEVAALERVADAIRLLLRTSP